MNVNHITMIIVGILGTALTFARRWKNRDSQAGLGIAGWTIATIFLVAIH